MRDRIIRVKQACKMLGVSRATLWRMHQRGEGPRKIRISRGVVGYSEKDLLDYIQDKPLEEVEGVQT
jgi:predicted DNA-binding transcriptional regulator AlpA